jgi:hypothetical protein
VRQDSRSFGRTGPARVVSCGCNVLPWEDCEHSAWDRAKSLQRVIEDAGSYVPSEALRAPVAPDRRLAGVIERARQIAKLAQEMESLLSETESVRA